MEAKRCTSYIEKVKLVIRELNPKIEIQKKLKSGYEKSFLNMKEILSSKLSLRKSASADVDHYRTHIEQIKATLRQRGTTFAEKLVGEFCSTFWKSDN